MGTQLRLLHDAIFLATPKRAQMATAREHLIHPELYKVHIVVFFVKKLIAISLFLALLSLGVFARPALDVTTGNAEFETVALDTSTRDTEIETVALETAPKHTELETATFGLG